MATDWLIQADAGVSIVSSTRRGTRLIAAQGAYWRLYEAQQRQAEAEAVLNSSAEVTQPKVMA